MPIAESQCFVQKGHFDFLACRGGASVGARPPSTQKNGIVKRRKKGKREERRKKKKMSSPWSKLGLRP